MKKTTFFTLLGIMLALTACKYEDGPLASVRSKAARVENTWVPEKAEINGEDGLITDANGVKLIDGDPTGYYLALKEVTFLEQGPCQVVYRTTLDHNYVGTWELVNNDEVIRLVLGPPVFGMPYVSMDWEIKRLSENRLRVTYLWERNVFAVDFVPRD